MLRSAIKRLVHGASALPPAVNPAIDEAVQAERLKAAFRRFDCAVKREAGGLLHVCFCPNCNRGGENLLQRLYLHPKTFSFHCNTCRSHGPIAAAVEQLAQQSAPRRPGEQPLLQPLPSVCEGLSDERQRRLLAGDLAASLQITAVRSAGGKREAFLRFPTFASDGSGRALALYHVPTAPGGGREFFTSLADADAGTGGGEAVGALLFKSDSSTRAPTAVVVDDLFDALTLASAGGAPPVLFVPSLSQATFEGVPLLHAFDRVVFWVRGSERWVCGAAGDLGFSKCLLPSDRTLFPFECGPEQAAAMLGDAGAFSPVPHPQLLSSAGAVPAEAAGFRQLFADFARTGGAGSTASVPCRSLPSLSALTKGFRPGELTVVSGSTGCGKTTLLSQLSLDYAMQGVVTLWGSFEIRNHRLIAKMLRQLSPTAPSGCTEGDFAAVAERFRALPMHFLRFFGSTPFPEVLSAVDYAVRVNRAQHVLLDNLQFMLSGQDSGAIADRLAMADAVLHQVRDFCNRRQVHVTLVVHPRKEEDGQPLGINSVSGTAKATQEADNVILLQAFSDGRRFVEVKKNRWDGSVGAVQVSFNRDLELFYEKPPAGEAARRGGSNKS